MRATAGQSDPLHRVVFTHPVQTNNVVIFCNFKGKSAPVCTHEIRSHKNEREFVSCRHKPSPLLLTAPRNENGFVVGLVRFSLQICCPGGQGWILFSGPFNPFSKSCSFIVKCTKQGSVGVKRRRGARGWDLWCSPLPPDDVVDLELYPQHKPPAAARDTFSCCSSLSWLPNHSWCSDQTAETTVQHCLSCTYKVRSRASVGPWNQTTTRWHALHKCPTQVGPALIQYAEIEIGQSYLKITLLSLMCQSAHEIWNAIIRRNFTRYIYLELSGTHL